jgi:hypothetical protein
LTLGQNKQKSAWSYENSLKMFSVHKHSSLSMLKKKNLKYN